MSESAVRYHFPRFKLDGRVKWLYNPVLKKRFKNRPEERVRLQWVEFLLHQTNRKGSRIGFESPVRLRQEEHQLRADLILYDAKLKPQILIECKADRVSLGGGSAEQAARYNSDIDAEYIILSNGVSDLVYHKNGEKLQIDDLPLQLIKISEFEDSRGAQYWTDRGFCGSGGISTTFLNRFWAKHSDSTIRYLHFRDSVLPFSMDHYYRIYAAGESEKLAAGFMGFEGSGSYLIAVLNRKGINEAVFMMNIDPVCSGKGVSAKIYKKGEVSECDKTKALCDLLRGDSPFQHQKLTNEIVNFF